MCSESHKLKFICFECNELMCSVCTLDHCKQQPKHLIHCHHVTKIKQSLNNIFKTEYANKNNHNHEESISNNDDESVFSKTMLSIWESLRSSTYRYQRLSTTENEIKQHFEQLHQYLIREEHKLQRDIINDKHTITNQIDYNINHLKNLLNIINIFNKLNSNNDNNSSYDNQSIISDTTTLYSTTIMESITTSSSLQSFINHNNQTLFNDHHDVFNIDELLKQHNNDSTSLLLDIIHKYNNQFNESTTKITDNNNLTLSSYKLSIKQPDFNQLNSIIEQSIKLDNIESTESINTTSITNNNDNKQSYIFTTHTSKGATLIITNNNSNSKSKSIEHIGDIKVIKGDSNMSVCYDGQDHIYLVNGLYISNRIDRFNIKTMKFERYHRLIGGYGMQVSSMIFKGSLYSVSYKVLES
ncbi:hypothetical protein PPL_04886 [Heterostelium album PN500]|uniref:B box-type domain-containing protein n=1 Tax=Heterostelium pallidum (strain ATCC 26659 / Pp 5 / PN500) TaxID=670386 RepID=D3B8U3_HETP5|nr:hypothetical protein PPL_04886 [Heterostelium album PN500]EFA82461.1 hypothetical protein PPL_04886 [Heterostelium album PN500]|eukprot:XP_020434578.1 hypothetical protein PPL_04886 [Heterostelium album PN500]